MARILFVTQTHNVWGGMEQWLHHFSLWLQREGWEVFAALPRGARFNDPEAYLREHPHLRLVTLDVRAGTERTRVTRLAQAIRDVRPDIVLPIASGAVFDAVAMARTKGASPRLIVPVRSMHPDLFCNIAGRFEIVDQVVAISRLIEAVLRELLPAASDRLHYVRHGARPPHRSHFEGGGPLRAGFVGRIEESTKRVSDLASLADALDDDVELHVFGSGPDEALLRHPRITMHGALSQQELYERAYPMLDALLLFSPAEGSPNAVYEAMQHGVVPVVARYAGQVSEAIVRDGETGMTFPVGDVAAAAAALRLLAGDRARHTALSVAAVAEVREDTDERMHRDWQRILERALALPPKGGAAVRLPRAGRIDFLPPAIGDAIRRLRRPRAVDGWDEWPGTAPAAGECVERVRALIARLDAEGVTYTPKGK